MRRTVMIATLAMLFAIVPAASATPGDNCENQTNNTYEKLLDCVTVDGARAHQAAFQAIADENGGIRAAGTPGYEESVDYVVERLEAAGWDVEVQEFPYTFFPAPTLEQLSPVEATYATGSFTGSASGEVNGSVIPVDLALSDPATSTSGCEATDFDGLDFSGPSDIALIQRGACFFSTKAVNATAAGAEAVIIFNQGTAGREGLVVGNASALPDGSPSNLTVPVVGASFTNGIALSQTGSTALVNVDPPESRPQKNVIAELAGRNDDNVVMAGAHLDSVPAGPGIQDNGSGSAALIEVAEGLAKLKPQNTLRFAWWGAEEDGLLGSTAYVADLSAEEQDRIALYLNFDMIGSPNHVFFIYDGNDSDGVGAGPGPDGSAEIEALFESFYTLVDEPFKGTDFSGRSDYGPFIEVGIPAGGLFTGAEVLKTDEEAAIWGGVAGEQYDPCYHQACDTFDNINLHAYDINVDAVAYAALTYAYSTESINGVPGKIVPGAPVVPKARTTDVQLLAINDFHGNLEPPFLRPTGAFIGGVEFLDTHLSELEATNPNTLVVSAGDLIGASPLLSGLFHDEPTIEAANLFGLDFNAVGNHEFDEGVDELLRMQDGGCHPDDGCQDGTPFEGAQFQFLAANVAYNDGSGTILPPYSIVEYPGVKIALVGMTLEGTPSIVTPSGIQDVSFADEAETVNALVPELKRRGVETIVVLLHEGGFPSAFDNTCPGISGPIVDIVERTSDEVDLFVTGHTHQAYNCVIDGRPVTSAYQYGGMITDIDMSISRATKEPVAISINNVLVTRDVEPDADQTALLQYWSAFADEVRTRVVGTITADILRARNAAGESPLGDRIADAQLWATSDVQGAQIAFMNPGGIRADLIYANQASSESPGEVTFGEVFTVQPFQNTLVTMNLTGAQIDTLLEQQFDNPSPGSNRILQVSEGFTYTWSMSAPTGSKVDPTTIRLNGVMLDPAATYRITANSFVAAGGDNFTVMTQGTDQFNGPVDSEVFADYVGALSPLAPGPVDRITATP